MKEKKAVGVLVGIALVVCGAGAIAYQSVGGGGGTNAAASSGGAYFSTDDGQSYFADDVSKLPPFDYNGKPAVRARVFQCGGKPFVAYLERYTSEALRAQQALNAAKDVKPGPNGPRIDARTIQVASTGREVKRPGDKAWVPALGAAGGRVMSPKCPGGKGDPVAVEP